MYQQGLRIKAFYLQPSVKRLKALNNIVCLGMFITYTFYFFKNQIILAEPQYSYYFSKFQAHLYIYIYHPHEVFMIGYGWFEGKILYFNTQICVYHILFTDETTDYVEQTMLSNRIIYFQNRMERDVSLSKVGYSNCYPIQ